MSNEITALVENWVNEATNGTDIFLVEVRKGVKDGRIAIFIDADEGVTIDKCTLVNRYLNEKLEEMDPDHNYTTAVSSPGVDKALKLPRQYLQHKGRILEIKRKDGALFKGWLKEIGEKSIILEDRKINLLSNKKVKPDNEIDFDQIAESHVIVSFH